MTTVGGEPLSMAEASSFEQSGVSASAAGTEFVLLASPSGGVELVDHEDHFRLVRGETVTDVAAGSHAYTLTDGEITAYARTGGRLWTNGSITAPAGITADATDGRLLVRTADGELVTLADQTGDEIGRRRLPHADAPDEPTVVAHDGRTLIANWSSFTLLGEGEPVERRLNGAVRAAGLVGQTAVLGLKDGSLVAYTDGAQTWEVTEQTSWLAPVGRDRLFCVTKQGLVGFDEAGERRPVPAVPASGTHAATADGRLVCHVAGGTARVFHATGDPASAVSLELPAEIPRGVSSVELTVSNTGDSLADTTGRFRGTGIEVASREVDAGLQPGAERRLELGVDSIEDDEATIALVDGEQTVASATARVVEPEEAVAVEAQPVEADGQTVTVRVSVENDGDTPIAGGDAAGERFGQLAAGESVTRDVRLTAPVDRIRVSLADAEDRSIELGIGSRLASVSVEPGPEGYVEATVRNDAPCPLEDELVVSGVPTPEETVTRQIEVARNGKYVWSLPSLAGGRREISAQTTTDRDRCETDPGSVDRPTQPSVANSGADEFQAATPRAEGGSTSDRSATPDSSADSEQPTVDVRPDADRSQSDREPDDATLETPGGSAHDTGRGTTADARHGTADATDSQPADDANRGTTADASSGPADGVGHGTTSETADDASRGTGDDAGGVSVERRLETRTPTVGQTFRERIRVENRDTERKPVRIRANPGGLDSETTVPPNGAMSGERALVAYEDATLPPPQVSLDEETVTGESEQIRTDAAPLTLYVWWTGDEPAVAVAAAAEGVESRINSVEVAGREAAVAATVPAGETVRQGVEISAAPTAETVVATVRCVIDGEPTVIETLCPSLPDVPITDPMAGLAVAVTDGSSVSDGTGTVYLRVTNEGPQPVGGFRLAADGSGIDEAWYEPTEVASLAPGESVEQKLPISTDEPELAASLRLVDTESGERLGTIELTGPAESSEQLTVTGPEQGRLPEFPPLVAEDI